MSESTFGGWAVSVAAYRDVGETFQIRTKPYTVSTFERADAERYARDETVRDFPPEKGWTILVSSMPLWWLPCEEVVG